MLIQAGHGISASGIAGANFFAKGCDGGLSAAVVVEKGVKDVEGVFRRLASGKGAELHRQEWAGFADANGEFLLYALKVYPFDGERASRGQSAIDAGEDVGGDAVNRDSAVSCGRTFGEKVYWDGEVADLFHEARAAKFVFGQAEALGLEVHLEASVLAERGTDGDTEVGIERHRARQVPRYGEVAAEVFRDESADEHEVTVPGAKAGPDGEKGAFGCGHANGVVFAVGFVFHGRQKPSQLRSAMAWSGPRRPVCCRSM